MIHISGRTQTGDMKGNSAASHTATFGRESLSGQFWSSFRNIMDNGNNILLTFLAPRGIKVIVIGLVAAKERFLTLPADSGGFRILLRLVPRFSALRVFYSSP